MSARWPALDLDLGGRISYAKYTDTCNEAECANEPEWGVQLGPYVDVRGGWKRFKVGPRVELAFDFTRDETIILMNPLMARWAF